MESKLLTVVSVLMLTGCLEDPSNFTFPLDGGNPNVNNVNNQNNVNNLNNINNVNNVNNINNVNNQNNLNNVNNVADMNVEPDMPDADMASDMTTPDMTDDQDMTVQVDAGSDMAVDMCVIQDEGEELCDGIDNDCDGTVDNAESYRCPLSMGVCEDAKTADCPMDLTSDPFTCDGDQYGESYEEVETSCGDEKDNDCDGLEDCADPDCDAKACGENGEICMNQACQ